MYGWICFDRLHVFSNISEHVWKLWFSFVFTFAFMIETRCGPDSEYKRTKSYGNLIAEDIVRSRGLIFSGAREQISCEEGIVRRHSHKCSGSREPLQTTI